MTGIVCPKCGHDKMVVLYGRDHPVFPVRTRRRECKKCFFRINTYEIDETSVLIQAMLSREILV